MAGLWTGTSGLERDFSAILSHSRKQSGERVGMDSQELRGPALVAAREFQGLPNGLVA